MDIHYSSTYFWADTTGKRISFNELDYPTYEEALLAFDVIKKNNLGVHPQAYTYKDVDSIKATFLIDNVERAFDAWKSPWAKNVNFQQFCEYILPYRASVEPLQDWRKT